MYTEKNFHTKKQLKSAVEAFNTISPIDGQRMGRAVYYFEQRVVSVLNTLKNTQRRLELRGIPHAEIDEQIRQIEEEIAEEKL